MHQHNLNVAGEHDYDEWGHPWRVVFSYIRRLTFIDWFASGKYGGQIKGTVSVLKKPFST